MNLFRWHRSFLVAVLLTVTAGCLSGGVALTLTPSPDLYGDPNSTVGWGFTIANDTADYIEFSSSQFCLTPVILNPVLACTLPLTGVFEDIIVGNDPIIGPGSSLSQDFDPIGLTTGIGYFEIDPNAAPPSSDVGQVVLTYDGYDADPNLGGNQVLFSVPLAADASVTVIPEPATVGLVAAVLPGLVAMGLPGGWRRRRMVRRMRVAAS